jgi:superfamily I DNA/RNA helicase
MVSEAELDDEQYKIRMLKSGNYLIEGSAGSGKTVLALQKAKEIQESKTGTYLVVIFTKTLRTFIEDGVRSLGLDPNRVCHFHDLNNLNISSVDYVIADEVQDFDDSQVQALINLANKHFIFFGDNAQQIYSSRTNGISLNRIKQLAGIPENNHKRLHKNYRLPKPIAEFAQNIATYRDDLVNRCVKASGDKPVIIHCKNFNSELDYIESVIRNEGWSDVGILLPNNSEVKKVKDYYNLKRFPVEYKYDIKAGYYNNTTYNTLNFYTDLPKVITYHSSKGLQFEHVFLPNCSIDSNLHNYQDALYVATTRASVSLIITYSDKLSRYISAIPNRYYKLQNKK